MYWTWLHWKSSLISTLPCSGTFTESLVMFWGKSTFLIDFLLWWSCLLHDAIFAVHFCERFGTKINSLKWKLHHLITSFLYCWLQLSYFIFFCCLEVSQTQGPWLCSWYHWKALCRGEQRAFQNDKSWDLQCKGVIECWLFSSLKFWSKSKNLNSREIVANIIWLFCQCFCWL
jgi:hypothetical protein